MRNGYRDVTGEDEKVREMNDGDDCITMRMYLMPQNCAFKKKVKMLYLMLYMFCYNKTK